MRHVAQSGRPLRPSPTCRHLLEAVRCLVLAVVFLTLPALAAAQGGEAAEELSRAEEAAEVRRAKASAETDYQPSRAESAFLYIEDNRLLGRVFNPPAGWFIQVGGLTEGAGFGMGGGRRFASGMGSSVDLRGLVSIGGAYRADLAWRSDPDLTDRVGFTAGAAIERHANQRFYGLGPDTTLEFDSGFALNERRGEAAMNVRITDWLTASVGAGVSQVDLRDLDFDFIDEDDEALSSGDVQVQQYRAGAIPGLDDTRFVSVQGQLLLDTREAGRAGGSRIVLRQTLHRDRSSTNHDFSASQIEIQQFIPIWSGTRVFALRAVADRASAGDGHTVPFYLQPTVGGSRSLRAYDRQRFRDTSALLLQAEYRYDVNAFLSGALFIDAGQVAADWSELRSDAFRKDYGVGLRIGYGAAVVLRADLALGGESPRLLIALNGVF